MNQGLEQIIRRGVNRESKVNFDELWHGLNTEKPLTFMAEFVDSKIFQEEWNRILLVTLVSGGHKRAVEHDKAYGVRAYHQAPAFRMLAREVGD